MLRGSLPTIIATIGAYDAVTGHMLALTDGTFATALRTGAASGVASRVLARPESSVLGLIGCGAQAITQLHGMLRSFDIRQVLYHDVDSGAAVERRDVRADGTGEFLRRHGGDQVKPVLRARNGQDDLVAVDRLQNAACNAFIGHGSG